ncbi:unnamed protein product [Cyprideis torosa]|uniref:Uncharacterized protein n=1 Tax=Cyprideis torosa TaxID=163714 RepID=A0A7R8ZTM6_9CRUS|nr:unnamed protein product [Cyprideis torosa]CAG0898355.1 unnamed protein product [Cyprideis torosa]
MQLKCRFYEQKYPEVDDVVMVKMRNIADMGAYVDLLEYNSIEAKESGKGRVTSEAGFRSPRTPTPGIDGTPGFYRTATPGEEATPEPEEKSSPNRMALFPRIPLPKQDGSLPPHPPPQTGWLSFPRFPDQFLAWHDEQPTEDTKSMQDEL